MSLYSSKSVCVHRLYWKYLSYVILDQFVVSVRIWYFVDKNLYSLFPLYAWDNMHGNFSNVFFLLLILLLLSGCIFISFCINKIWFYRNDDVILMKSLFRWSCVIVNVVRQRNFPNDKFLWFFFSFAYFKRVDLNTKNQC